MSDVHNAAMEFLLRELLSETKGAAERLVRVEALQREVLECITRVYALESRQHRHGRRLSMLEQVVYEGASAPPMAGPPEMRRPVIPPADPKEDSDIYDMRALKAEVDRFKQREERRDSFWMKARWNFAMKIVAGIMIAVVSVLGTWLAHKLGILGGNDVDRTEDRVCALDGTRRHARVCRDVRWAEPEGGDLDRPGRGHHQRLFARPRSARA